MFELFWIFLSLLVFTPFSNFFSIFSRLIPLRVQARLSLSPTSFKAFLTYLPQLEEFPFSKPLNSPFKRILDITYSHSCLLFSKDIY